MSPKCHQGVSLLGAGLGAGGAVCDGLLGGGAEGTGRGDWVAGMGLGVCAAEAEIGDVVGEEEADPSPPFAKDATGFGMTVVGWAGWGRGGAAVGR